MPDSFDKKFYLASALILLSVLVTILSMLRGCGGSKTTVINEGSSPAAQCGESPDGTVRELECPEGELGNVVDLCRNGTWKTVSDSCKEPPVDTCDDQVLFAEIKPILTEHCLGCHFTPDKYDSYGVARRKLSGFLGRIKLPVDNPERMPKDPNPPLSNRDIDALEKWREDGSKDGCGDSNGEETGFYKLDSLETVILGDLSSLSSEDRVNARYLVTSHKVNHGDTEEDLAIFRQAIDKNLNALNVSSEQTFQTQPIEKTIYRLDLRAYGLDQNDWRLIEDADPFDLESFTDKGETLKFLSGARKPWIHFDTFGEVVGSAPVYYDLLGIPSQLNVYLDAVGVDIIVQLQAFTAFFLGANGSEISLNKNRLIARFEGNDRFPFTWITFDPIDLAGVAERNLFEFPLLAGAGGTGTRAFEFAASEVITLGPGGLIFSLWNSDGRRQDAAPLNVVVDTRSPLDPEIQNPIDCNRCHAAGLIPMADQIRGHVEANASEFDSIDVDIILELYRPAGSNTAIFQADNGQYGQIMNRLGVDLALDPITFANDRLSLDWDLSEVAAFVLIPTEDFRILLGRSSVARAQIGQLLTGGTITKNQFIQVLPDLKKDLSLFKEKL